QSQKIKTKSRRMIVVLHNRMGAGYKERLRFPYKVIVVTNSSYDIIMQVALDFTKQGSSLFEAYK
nr:hypothetical protein [Thermoproteota archaeon]